MPSTHNSAEVMLAGEKRETNLKLLKIYPVLVAITSIVMCIPASGALQRSSSQVLDLHEPAYSAGKPNTQGTILVINGKTIDIPSSSRQTISGLSKIALARLVDEELVLQKALGLQSSQGRAWGAAPTPGMRNTAISDYLNSIAAQAPKAEPVMVKSYFENHPLVFARRQSFVFELAKILVDKQLLDLSPGMLNANLSMNEVRALIQKAHLNAKFGTFNLPSESLPANELTALQTMQVDSVKILTEPNCITVLSLKSRSHSPLSFERAQPEIERLLNSLSQQQTLTRELQQLRASASIQCSSDLPCSEIPASDLGSQWIQTPKRSALQQAWTALSTELQVVTKDEYGGPGWWNAIQSMTWSNAAKDAAFRLFGKVDPVSIHRFSTPNGELTYSFDIAPFKFQDGLPAEVIIESSSLSGRSIFDKARTHATTQASMQTMRIDTNQQPSIEINDIIATAKSYKGVAGIWFGTNRFIASSVRLLSAQTDLAIHKLATTFSLEQKDKTVAFGFSLSAASASFAGETIGPINMDWNVKHLDRDAFASMFQALKTSDVRKSEAARIEQVTALFDRIGPSLLTTHTAIELQNLSVSYQGFTAKMRGTLGFGHIQRGDVYSLPRLMELIRGHITAIVPKGFVKKIVSAYVHRRQSRMNTQETSVDRDKEAFAEKEAINHIMAKLIDNGIFTVNGDNLQSIVDIREGSVLINGRDLKTIYREQ